MAINQGASGYLFFQRVNLEVKVGNKMTKETAVRTPVSTRVRVRVEVGQRQKTKEQPRRTPKPKEKGELFCQNFLQKHSLVFSPGLTLSEKISVCFFCPKQILNLVILI